MANHYIYQQDLRQNARVPEKGILSQTLQDGDGTKVVLFGFAPEQELSAHTAPYPATITILKGEALLKLGSDERQAAEGTFVYMPAYLEHGIQAKTEVVMLLTMIKGRALPTSGSSGQ
jgi:quercetin dioxygenase-like cupin family protein